MKRVCEELEEGRGSLQLRHKNFQCVSPFQVERKAFDGLIVIVGKKGFQRRLHFES